MKILLYIILLILLVDGLYTILTTQDKFSAYILQSDSMRPVLERGDVVFVKNEQEYKAGDVITFIQGEAFATHRIIFKIENGSLYFVTKGDANNNIDSVRLSPHKIVGKVFLRLRYIGLIVLTVKDL